MKNPSTKDILNILDDLENKLSRHKTQTNSRGSTYSYAQYNPKYSGQAEINQYTNNYRNAALQSINSLPPQQIISSSNEYNIRKIIKDEFSSLILPYQQDLHNNLNILETKINNNTNKIKELNSNNLDNLNNILNRGGMTNYISNNNQPLINNNQYVLRVEYDNKILELEHQLSTLNSFSK